MLGLAILTTAVLLLLAALPLYALSADRAYTRAASQDMVSLPVRAATKIYKGGWVGVDPGGYAKPFEPGDELIGMAYEGQDNTTGAAGALNVRVIVQGDFELTISSVAVKHVGMPAYATADDAQGLAGHADAYIGRIIQRIGTNKALVRLKSSPCERAPNGVGSMVLTLAGPESCQATGATAGTEYVAGLEYKSILGLGVYGLDAEDGGLKLDFDATAEVALASVRTTNDTFQVDLGVTFEAVLVVSDKGDNAALDIDFGLGTALTTNSEANIDHADMVQLACFHMDGNSDNINAQSDDNTTDVAAADTTIDNDSTTDVPKRFKIIVRPTGAVEFWIDGARVLSSTTFAVLSTAALSAFVNMEKTSDDTTAVLLLKYLRVAGGKAA